MIIFFICVTYIYFLFICNKYLKTVKLKDFEEETKELIEDGVDFSNVNMEEIQLNKGFFSDNILMIFTSLLIFALYIILNKHSNNIISIAIIPLLTTLFIIDVRMKELPFKITKYVLLLGIINFIYNCFANKPFDLYSATLSIFGMFACYTLIIFLTKGALGGGDLHLITFLTFFVNSNDIQKLLIWPFFIGSIYGLILLIRKKDLKNYKFAFGPFIIISYFLIVFL